MLERILSDHIENNKILDQKQFGFVPKSNTQTAATHILHKIASQMDQGKKYVVCVFVDISKAFDCVNHKILIDRLKYYGIL